MMKSSIIKLCIALIVLCTTCCICLLLVSCKPDNSYSSTTPSTGDNTSQSGSGSSQQPPQEHNHSFVSSATSPTCTQAGNITYTCNCGESYSEKTEPLGHKLQFVQSDDGISHRQECVRCDYVTEYVTHLYKIVEDIPATCVQAGRLVQNCVCGSNKIDIIPAAGHEYKYFYDEINHWKQCAVCSEKQAESRDGHYWEAVSSSPATCSDDGVVLNECVCGKQKSEVTPRFGHDFQVCSKIEPNCESDGAISYACSRCDETYTEKINRLGHIAGAWQYDENTHWSVCGRCDKHFVETHDWGEVDGSRIAATCVQLGSYVESCRSCGFSHTILDEEQGFASHSLEYFSARKRTETRDGWIDHWQCSVCMQCFADALARNPLPDEEVFDRVPYFREVSLSELIEIAKTYSPGVPSTELFQVTAEIKEKSAPIYYIGDGENLISVSISNPKYDSGTIHARDILTLRGYLICELSGNITLSDAEIVSVDDGNESTVSLKLEISGESGVDKFISGLFSVSTDDNSFDPITIADLGCKYYFNTLTVGDEIYFEYLSFGNVRITAVIINDKVYEMTDSLTIKVTEDMICEFVFAA